jgi:hypothetical protein
MTLRKKWRLNKKKNKSVTYMDSRREATVKPIQGSVPSLATRRSAPSSVTLGLGGVADQGPSLEEGFFFLGCF